MSRIEKLEEMLATMPGDAFLQHALALEKIKLGNDEEARLLFENILAANEGYTGSYYHLGKLFERQGDYNQAIRVYEKGMEVCKKSGDKHAENELRMAWEEIAEDN